MGNANANADLNGYFCGGILFLTICTFAFQHVVALDSILRPLSDVSVKLVLSDPPLGLLEPIEISPSALPRYPNPYLVEPLSPMYPSFPSTYEPILTGKCPVNFSSISSIVDQTASDCAAPLAELVGDVICCPQFRSLLHIFEGAYSLALGSLAMPQDDADNCFSDLISILVSKGANSTISTLCSVNATNLTVRSCPISDTMAFEKAINASKLLDSCSMVDQLKECCRPICQLSITEAAVRISVKETSVIGSSNFGGGLVGSDVVGDCKQVVYAWLAMKLSQEAANNTFRLLSSCKVNKVCPLELREPTAVINACRDSASHSLSCCSSLNTYVTDIQKQMLITNKQAINCATLFGSMLQKGGVLTNVYELCHVDLKDFSLQAYGQEGCLLRSLPANVIIDNVTGVSFTCDLNDNIAAPWPSSSSLSSMSLCAPEMSLPALPMAQNSRSPGNSFNRVAAWVPSILHLIAGMILLAS